MMKRTAITLALALAGFAAHADTGLFISEYIEGSSNNKALELYNPTDAAIDLADYQLAFYFNGNSSAGYTLNLASSLAPGETYVIAHSSAAQAILDVADQTGGGGWFNGDDAVALRRNGELIDVIGTIGTDPGSQWGSGDASTQNNTLRRQAGITRGDSDGSDSFEPADQWDGFAQDTFDGLGSHGDGNPPPPPPIGECGDPATAIHTIQGSGNSSPLEGNQVEVEAIVINNLEAGYQGLNLQMADAEADGDVTTSEGIFVYTGNAPLGYAPGERVRLAAEVDEFFDLTQLRNVSNSISCATGQPLPATTTVSLPVSSLERWEQLEGMRVQFGQSLVVNEVYNLGRYGQFQLSSSRHMIPTQVVLPGEPAQTLAAQQLLDRITVDDGQTSQNPDPVIYPAPELTAANTLRSGDSITNLEASLHYAFGEFLVLPTQGVTQLVTNPRPPAPVLSEDGNLKVATFNVLNYFNGDGQGGGFPTARGADNTSEYARQHDKLIAALVALDADIIGLVEIENDGYGEHSAIQSLVNGLNAALPAPVFSVVDPGVAAIGDDQIAVGMLYRHDKVTPAMAAKILASDNSPLDDTGQPLFLDSKNRPMLSQQFRLLENNQPLVLAINHLKSKGGDCDDIGDPDNNDGQGNCNLTRTRAARAIGQWLAASYPSMPTLVMGDLNAYAKEDPLSQLANDGFADVFGHLGKQPAYSYVFRGKAGQLDHALANDALMAKVVDAANWHINTDEPRVLDYNEEFKSANQQLSLYAPDAYRSSDHDPVVVALQLESDINIDLRVHKANRSRSGRVRVDLRWQAEGVDEMVIYRNGEQVATVEGRSRYMDRQRNADGNSFSYQVCALNGPCSDEVTVSF